MNITFYDKHRCFFAIIARWRDRPLSIFSAYNPLYRPFKVPVKNIILVLTSLFSALVLVTHQATAEPIKIIHEPVQACVVARNVQLTAALRKQFAQCLGWQSDASSPICRGNYQPITVAPLAQPEAVRIMADSVSFYRDKRSTLSGHVEIQQEQRVVNAQTAYVYRDAKTNKISKIEFLGDVHYLEPDRIMIAKTATVNPEDKSGHTEDVLYRFNLDGQKAPLPAWGRAGFIQRFANKDYLLRQATYTTCAPQDNAWVLEADSIAIDNTKGKGVARRATFKVHNVPLLYLPYMSFPTSNERKSGFLLPQVGYSNVGGFDLALPYYVNLAPNYDMTLTPHLYTERGVMLGGQYRFLTKNSVGAVSGNFLPHDRAYNKFLQNNATEFPWLQGKSDNRWTVGVLETTHFTPKLQLNVNVQDVSDDYYLQDFSTNLALLTQRQLLRQVDLMYTTDNWQFSGMAQSYHTLHPVNESVIADVYERLPQFVARGFYYDLPFNANLNILGEYDQFVWPKQQWYISPVLQPQGPRLHVNPILSLPQVRPWGFFTPSIQLVENYYDVQKRGSIPNTTFNRAIPRYSVDTGLYFEKDLSLLGNAFTQTLEPRLFYLNVPFQNQTSIPVYDAGNMIFNTDQLFRTNRFSGFDRIGDANQLAYALTSRWLSEETGAERANVSVGQIKYFADRKVQLCQSISGYCVDSPYQFGNLSSVSGASPIASRAVYNLNPVWGITGDYVWDPATRATNNGDLNLHYKPSDSQMINIGYSYLVNGDLTQVVNQGTQDNALHQGTVAIAWPLTDRWSAVGAYTHNISKNYSMMSFAGLQYDNCCWAMRALGGRTFKNLNAGFEPQYNNNIYFQLLFKGLGTLANSNPSTIIGTYLPGYKDQFRR